MQYSAVQYSTVHLDTVLGGAQLGQADPPEGVVRVGEDPERRLDIEMSRKLREVSQCPEKAEIPNFISNYHV